MCRHSSTCSGGRSGPSERTRARIGLISRSGRSSFVPTTTPSARLRPYSTSTASPATTSPSASGTEYVNVCPPRGPAASTPTSTSRVAMTLVVVTAESPSLDEPVVNDVSDGIGHADSRVDNQVVDGSARWIGQLRVENIAVVDLGMHEAPLGQVVLLPLPLPVEQLLQRDLGTRVVAQHLAQLAS